MSNSIYSGKLRIRTAGLLIENGKLLLVKLKSPISKNDIWTPPGGGVDFGELIHEALKREFHEETGLSIKVGELVYINELLESQFHAIEFFFKVEKIKGDLKLGFDPEHSQESQLLKELKFFKSNELTGLLVKPEFLKTHFWDEKNEFSTVNLNFKDEEG